VFGSNLGSVFNVYIKELKKNKYGETYYVVYRIDGNKVPALSLPLFMSHKEYEKDFFGYFNGPIEDYQSVGKTNEEKVKNRDRIFDIEDYLKTDDALKALNAIANKKRVLGLSRMLVGEVNKGGKRTRRKRNNKRKTKRRV